MQKLRLGNSVYSYTHIHMNIYIYMYINLCRKMPKLRLGKRMGPSQRLDGL